MRIAFAPCFCEYLLFLFNCPVYGFEVWHCNFVLHFHWNFFLGDSSLTMILKVTWGKKSKTDHGPGNSQEGSSTMILNFPSFDRYLLKAFHSLPATSPGPWGCCSENHRKESHPDRAFCLVVAIKMHAVLQEYTGQLARIPAAGRARTARAPWHPSVEFGGSPRGEPLP